jgi:hypothetical protein
MNDEYENASKLVYPVVALRDGIIFPETENALLFGREKSSSSETKRQLSLYLPNTSTKRRGVGDSKVKFADRWL